MQSCLGDLFAEDLSLGAQLSAQENDQVRLQFPEFEQAVQAQPERAQKPEQRQGQFAVSA